MADYFNDDFRDFIRAINNHEVEYVVVGGMAVILHGYVRTTGDMDIWVRQTKTNYHKIRKAFFQFGMPVFDMTEDRFLSDECDVWMFGVEPVKIELLTAVKGLDFEETFALSQIYMEDNIAIRFLHINSLLEAKRAAGRFKDLEDIKQLQRKK